MDSNMKLKRFKVTNFRSVIDSGWINCEDVTTLVGVNESGKTNILLALWKLNPVKNGEIDTAHDVPASKVSELRDHLDKTYFIRAVFELGESADGINKKLGSKFSEKSELYLGRNYKGIYHYRFESKEDQKRLEELQTPRKVLTKNGEEKTVEFTYEKIFQILNPFIPTFVYYSQYSNLESRIYLPDAIRLLNGENVSGGNANDDRVRITRILFDYMRVNPNELYEMGRNANDLARQNRGGGTPTQSEINQAVLEKEKRTLLLQNAGRRLTNEFNERWNQGKYLFRFYADGDSIYIAVSDDKRPEEINLAQRSTGLQCFLSFYIIFLMECQNENKNSILLLDETGLMLHPIAQKDLAKFFNLLASKNQIINTTHSPFIVDPERIDRCRVVYSDDDGGTVVSENLRAGAGENGQNSIYAVHAALGLTVSDFMLYGCQAIIVEGYSDQIYLSAIKRFLIREKKYPAQREIVFVPVGGAKNVSSVASLLSTADNDLPMVFLDSDNAGIGFKTKIENGLYRDSKKSIVCVKDITHLENSEIEDLIPPDFIGRGVNSILNIRNSLFAPVANSPIVPQIEEYAAQNNVTFDSGAKVDLAKFFNMVMEDDQESVPEDYKKMWVSLFKKLNG